MPSLNASWNASRTRVIDISSLSPPPTRTARGSFPSTTKRCTRIPFQARNGTRFVSMSRHLGRKPSSTGTAGRGGRSTCRSARGDGLSSKIRLLCPRIPSSDRVGLPLRPAATEAFSAQGVQQRSLRQLDRRSVSVTSPELHSRRSWCSSTCGSLGAPVGTPPVLGLSNRERGSRHRPQYAIWLFRGTQRTAGPRVLSTASMGTIGRRVESKPL
jgi:hypothetical protein